MTPDQTELERPPREMQEKLPEPEGHNQESLHDRLHEVQFMIDELKQKGLVDKAGQQELQTKLEGEYQTTLDGLRQRIGRDHISVQSEQSIHQHLVDDVVGFKDHMWQQYEQLLLKEKDLQGQESGIESDTSSAHHERLRVLGDELKEAERDLSLKRSHSTSFYSTEDAAIRADDVRGKITTEKLRMKLTEDQPTTPEARYEVIGNFICNQAREKALQESQDIITEAQQEIEKIRTGIEEFRRRKSGFDTELQNAVQERNKILKELEQDSANTQLQEQSEKLRQDIRGIRGDINRVEEKIEQLEQSAAQSIPEAEKRLRTGEAHKAEVEAHPEVYNQAPGRIEDDPDFPAVLRAASFHRSEDSRLFAENTGYDPHQEAIKIFKARFPEKAEFYDRLNPTMPDGERQAITTEPIAAAGKEEDALARRQRIGAANAEALHRITGQEVISNPDGSFYLKDDKKSRVDYTTSAGQERANQDARLPESDERVETPYSDEEIQSLGLERADEKQFDEALEKIASVYREHLRSKQEQITVDRNRLKSQIYLKGSGFDQSLSQGRDAGLCLVRNELIVGSVQGSFEDWSGNPDTSDQRNSLIETIARDFIAEGGGKKEVRYDSSIRKAFEPNRVLGVKLQMIKGPDGPIFIAKDGSHRIAASKLAEMPKIMARTEVLRERETVTTESAEQAKKWQKMIERGLVDGEVRVEKDKGYSLRIKKQLLPWCSVKPKDFFSANIAYKKVYPDSFKKMKSLKDGKPIPEEIFLDKTGKALELFLDEPDKLAAYIEQLKK